MTTATLTAEQIQELREEKSNPLNRVHIVMAWMIQHDAKIRHRYHFDTEAHQSLDNRDPLFTESPPRFDTSVLIDARKDDFSVSGDVKCVAELISRSEAQQARRVVDEVRQAKSKDVILKSFDPASAMVNQRDDLSVQAHR